MINGSATPVLHYIPQMCFNTKSLFAFTAMTGISTENLNLLNLF